MIHVRKAEPEFFRAVVEGRKTFEVRKEDDAVFSVGDLLVLEELDGTGRATTGVIYVAEITYVLRDSRFVQAGYAILSIRRAELVEANPFDSGVSE